MSFLYLLERHTCIPGIGITSPLISFCSKAPELRHLSPSGQLHGANTGAVVLIPTSPRVCPTPRASGSIEIISAHLRGSMDLTLDRIDQPKLFSCMSLRGAGVQSATSNAILATSSHLCMQYGVLRNA